jgi:predicted nuclease of predicted toxin-antitoxin system
MCRYLVDENLPCRFSIWSGEAYKHVNEMGDVVKDREVWEYAKKNHLTIITKDADFSDMVMIDSSPPRVIHIKFGNMKMKELHQTLSKIWGDICQMSTEYKLVRVYKDRIEGINL